MIENINVGSQANDHTGDKLRNAFIIVNENFDYIQTILDTCLIEGSVEISDINGLQTALDTLNEQVGYIPGLEQVVANLSSSIFLLNTSVDTINNNIILIDTEITDINLILTDIQAEIAAIQEELLLKVNEAPEDGSSYIRKDAEWVNVNTYVPSFKKIVEEGGDNIVTDGGKNIQFSASGFTTTMTPIQFKASLITGPFTEVNTGNIRLRSFAMGDAYIRNGGTANGVNFYLPAKPTGGYTFSTIDDLTNYVPYTGATRNVDLGLFGLTASSFQFTGLTNSGRFTWNDTDGTADLTLKGGNVTLQIGQEQVVRVVNKTATNITLQETAYQAVRITGAQGNRLKVDLAIATSDVLSAETIGLVTETILNNQEGFITVSGLVRGINTTGSLQSETWVDGDMLYLSPTTAGQITNVKPQAPNHLIVIGYVVRAHITQGQIFVKVDNGYELDELHNVKISGTPSNGSSLVYNNLSSVWENQTEEFRLRQEVRVISSDFIGTVAAANTPFVFSALASGSNTTTTYLNGTNPGVTRIQSSSTPVSGGLLSANNLTAGTIVPTIGQQMDFVFRTPNTIIGVGSTIRAGFMIAATITTDASNGFYMEIVDNQLYGKTANNSSRSQTATSYSISNGGLWFHMRITYKAASLIEYSLYNMSGTLLWSDTLTTNITTNAITCNLLAYSSASQAVSTEMINMDYLAFTLPTSTRGALN